MKNIDVSSLQLADITDQWIEDHFDIEKEKQDIVERSTSYIIDVEVDKEYLASEFIALLLAEIEKAKTKVHWPSTVPKSLKNDDSQWAAKIVQQGCDTYYDYLNELVVFFEVTRSERKSETIARLKKKVKSKIRYRQRKKKEAARKRRQQAKIEAKEKQLLQQLIDKYGAPS